MLAHICRLQRLYDQLPPQWYGWDAQGNPVYMILHKGFLSIRRGEYGGGLESAQLGDEIYSRQVDISWDPGYGEIKRLCAHDIELPEKDYGDDDNGSEPEHSGQAGGEFCVPSEAGQEYPESENRQSSEGPVDHPEGPEQATEAAEIAIKGGTVAPKSRGATGAEIDGLIRRWTASLSAAQERLSFNDRSNLNRLRFEKLQKVKEEDVSRRLGELLETMFTGGRFEVLIWVEKSQAVPDSEGLKLVVLKRNDPLLIGDIMRSCGVRARVNCNTVLFLLPSELDRRWCVNIIRYELACEALLADRSVSLSNEQKKLMRQEIQRLGYALDESVRKLYRIIRMPSEKGYRTVDLGASAPRPASIDMAVYERLLRDGDIVDLIEPQEIRSRYLKGKVFLSSADLYRSFLRVVGERRLADRSALTEGIRLGVEEGLFGIGRLEGKIPLCRHFMERAPVTLDDGEVIVSEKGCIGRGAFIA